MYLLPTFAVLSPLYAHYVLALSTDTLIPAELSSKIAANLKSSNITGIQVAVVRNGRTQLKAWGNKTETGEPLTPNTLMNIASCSKAFLAAAMGILMDDFKQKKNVTSLPAGVNNFTWTTQVKTLLPQWKLMDASASDNATIHDLLSHVTGVPGHDLSYAPSDSLADIAYRLRYLEPAYKLRQQWSYNNQMYMVASYIISKYSNASFTSFVEERIMKPAGMTQSTYSPTAAAQSGYLSDSFDSLNRRIPQAITDESADMIAGAGGVLSSAADMLHWVKIMLNKGIVPGSNTTVFSESVYTAVTTPYAVIYESPSLVEYGMGWMIATRGGRQVIIHEGAIPGGSSVVVLVPGDNPIGIVVLANTFRKAEFVYMVWSTIFDSLLNVDEKAAKFVDKRDILNPSWPMHDMTSMQSSLRLDTKVTNVPAVSLGLERFEGMYHNPGYSANFTLCTATSLHAGCANVISNFTAVDGPEKFNATAKVSLYASWPTFWTSHLRLIAFDDDKAGLFMFAGAFLFPSGYGVKHTPFEDSDIGSYAQFGVVGGKFGLGIAALSGAWDTPVWFERV